MDPGVSTVTKSAPKATPKARKETVFAEVDFTIRFSFEQFILSKFLMNS
jgi:hypothetical protein